MVRPGLAVKSRSSSRADLPLPPPAAHLRLRAVRLGCRARARLRPRLLEADAHQGRSPCRRRLHERVHLVRPSRARTARLSAPAHASSTSRSAIGPKATLALNVCDFTRYANNRRTVVWSNIFSLTVLVTLCAILGVVVTSATEVIYGKTTWNPLQVSSLMDSRAAQFFSALPWALSVLATNISGACGQLADRLLSSPTASSPRRSSRGP